MRRGVHDSGRGENIPEFGADVTAAFCEANALSLVIRSHQYVRQGYKVMHGGRLITLFSARNYFSSDGQTNDGETSPRPATPSRGRSPTPSPCSPSPSPPQPAPAPALALWPWLSPGAMLLVTPDANGHLRVHPKRLAHLDAGEQHASPAPVDWRVHLLRAVARCLGL